MKKIIIDVDTGTDDFIALCLALKSNKFDIVGITTVEGNCKLDLATKNTLKALDMCNRCDIEVYKGLENSFLDTMNATNVHGNNGLGNVEYTPSIKLENKMNAIDFLINTVKNNPNDITIVALGPLTNINECIKKDPTFANNVKEILIMGGSNGKGNITPYAEFNFYKDPKAADNVVNADFKSIKILGWDITIKNPLLKEYEDKLKNSNSKIANFIYDITRSTAIHDSSLYGGAIISDAILIAYLIDNSIAKFKYSKIDIIKDGEKAGMSKIEFVENSNCQVVTSINNNKFYEILIDYLTN